MLAPPDLVLSEMQEAKREIDSWVYDKTDGVVVGGPFKGMKILRDIAWKDTRLAPLLLGCYEEELHGEIEKQVDRLRDFSAPKIGVIGCAEGYYAIGLKRRLPNATVFAVDSDEGSLAICGKAAAANNVALIGNAPIDVVLSSADFLLVDCEGAEVVYLDPLKYPFLSGTHMLVEIHNYADQRADAILLSRFRGTHRITAVYEGPRNPNKYEMFNPLPSDIRWLAVNEGRPCLMCWFLMEPKGYSFV